jgi:AraC family transcriptional regulator
MGGLDSAATATQVLTFAPPTIVRQQTAAWNGTHVDNVELVQHEPFDYVVEGPNHLLIASERAERYDGETLVDGLPRSHVRAWSGKMTFVPAGSRLYGWQKPRALTRCSFLSIAPQGSLYPELRLAEIDLRPRLFFFDRDLWESALKLKVQAENPSRAPRAYVEALSIALAHELVRMNDGVSALPSKCIRGGLPDWQQKKLAQYIEDHLAEEISLLSLARLVQLSPYHFSRAFKQSFGLPPHRYLTSRRIERAKSLLVQRKMSVTEIGFEVGFGESGAFSAAFRKLTGETPTGYRRSLA